MIQQCTALPTGRVGDMLRQLSDQNLEVRAAWVRVRQAQAQVRQREAAQLPQVQASAEGTRADTGTPRGVPAAAAAAGGVREQVEASVAAEYELDLWNRLGNAAEAARMQAQAQRMDARAIGVSLSAQLLETWFDLGLLAGQRELVESQLKTTDQLLKLLKQRFVQGSGPLLDVLQQRQQLQALQSELAENQAEIALRRNQVAALLGQEPEALEEVLPARLPDLKPIDVDKSFSASLLARRPDLHAAFHQLQAADARLAAAFAQRLPSVRLSAALFDQSQDLSGLADSLLWRLGASVLAPIFDGGRIAAQVDEAQGARGLQLVQYRQTLLTALHELSNARIAEEREAVRLANLAEQRDIAEKAYRLARQQYLRGAVDYLRVLNALQSMLDLQQQSLLARRQHLSYRVQFCRALGVGWIDGTR